MPVSFELQDRIDNMFQYFGPCDASLFIDVPDDQYRRMGFFGKFQYRCSTFSYL